MMAIKLTVPCFGLDVANDDHGSTLASARSPGGI